MNENEENTITVPGRKTVVNVKAAVPSNTPLTSHTTAGSFEPLKHLLSDKPLRLPVPERR
ncbi:MAG: hypothetical protein WD851_20145 [Pirellulales bacterium]